MTTQAEELKAKIALEEQNRKKKIQALQKLNTKNLVDMLPDLEEKLETALRAEATFRDLNYGYLASRDSDCGEVKRILAELTIRGPGIDQKYTAPERDAWLITQRTKNHELATAIERHKSVVFNLETYKIDVDMAKKRLENIHRVLALRTAQIQFLTEH